MQASDLGLPAPTPLRLLGSVSREGVRNQCRGVVHGSIFHRSYKPVSSKCVGQVSFRRRTGSHAYSCSVQIVNRVYTFSLTYDESLALPAPFAVLATQNPIEMEGTYPLPEAQLDRFLLKIRVGYPSESEEVALTQHVTRGRVGDAFALDDVEAVATPADVVKIQEATAGIYVDESVVEYAVRITRATRARSGLAMGAGPRGALALVRAARAHALLEGRTFVTPDDIKNIAPAALRHRLQLEASADLEGRTTDDVVDDILAEVEAPRE